MVNTTIGVRPETFDRLKNGRYGMMQKLGKDLSYSDIIETLMDVAGWAKKGK